MNTGHKAAALPMLLDRLCISAPDQCALRTGTGYTFLQLSQLDRYRLAINGLGSG
jgi:hypothetical protein